MILVFIGLLCIILGVIFVFKYNEVRMILCIVLGVLLCFLGVFYPVSGYQETVIQEEYELEEIVPGENVYVIETKDNTVKYIITKINDEKEKVKVMYTGSNIEVVILENIIKPFIRKYSIKSKKSLFTFGMLPEKIEYKIFINEHHISQETTE